MKPIFFGITRSFWLAVVTVALFLIEDPTAVQALLDLLPPDWALAVAEFLLKVGPILTLAAAIYQRSGAARPYSLNPRDR